jgi:hypothetical protein
MKASTDTREVAREELLGPISGRLQTIRDMCVEGELQEAIDRAAREAEDLVAEVVELLNEA